MAILSICWEYFYGRVAKRFTVNFMADGTAWCGRPPVTREIQRGSLPLSVAILDVNVTLEEF